MTEVPTSRKPLTLHRLRVMHAAGEKIAMLTCYDATFAHLLDNAGVDCLLVGDSLGMVLQGEASTVPVSLQQMVYITPNAWRALTRPRGSSETCPSAATRSPKSRRCAVPPR